MITMLVLYVLTGIITLLGLAGLFAPVGPSKSHVTFRTDTAEDEDIIFVEDDELDPAEDTQPFISLPFFKVQAAVDGDEDKYGDDEVTQPFTVLPDLFQVPEVPPKSNNLPTRDFPAYGNVVVWP